MKYNYATVDASFESNGPTLRICPDTGNPVSLVDRKVTLHYSPQSKLYQAPHPLRIKGIGNKVSRCTDRVDFQLHLQQSPISVSAYVIDDLDANILLGVDVLGPNKALVDFEARQFKMGESSVPLHVLKQKKRMTAVISAKGVCIPPRSFAPVTLRPLDTGGSALLLPSHQAMMNQLIAGHESTVQAYNSTNQPMEIPARTVLGMADPNWNNATPIEAANWTRACHQGDEADLTEDQDVDSAKKAMEAVMRDYPKLSTSTKTSEPQPHSHESTGSYGATIYGDTSTTKRLDNLLKEFEKLFTDDGKTANLPEEEHLTIPLVNDWKTAGAKLNHKVYPMGPKDRELIDETHEKLHEQGRRSWSTEPTPFGFPVFVVWRTVEGKRKGRVVVDIRGLNRITMTDSYPMPLQTDVTSAVAGCQYITTVDMASFFYQWLVKHDDRHKLSVVSHRGRESFNVAVMGFKNSPPYVQRQMDRILRIAKCLGFAKAFVDDVVIYSRTLDEHIQHLRQVFTAFDELNLTVSGKKSFIGYPSIELLGQRVDGFGVYTSEQKLSAIAKLNFPTTVKDLERYLGLTGWLRNYIPYYAALAEPLQKRKTESLRTAPTGKHSRAHFTSTSVVEPTSELVDAFNALQSGFAKPSMLHHFDRTRPLYIHLDASIQRGFGIMIAHVEGDAISSNPPRTKTQPILFLSKTLSTAERRYWPTELEVACLVWTIKRMRWMVEACDKPVVVLTDHAATTAIATQTPLSSSSVDKLNNRLTRASQYLSQFGNLQVLYKPGREHIVPDALSRLSAPGQIDEAEDVLEDLVFSHHTQELHIDEAFQRQLIAAYDTDKHLSRVKAMLQTAEPGGTSFSVDEDGLIWIDNDDEGKRLCIPRALEGDIFHAAHDAQFHVGFHRLYTRIRSQYYVRKLAGRLRKYLEHCHECQTLSTKRHAPYGQLHPIQSPKLAFHTIAIDFIVALPLSNNYNAILTATCKFSKRILLIAGRDDYSAEAWAHRLLDALYQCDWGLPTVIISDRDPKFTSAMWKAIFKRLDTKLLMSTAYHPQTDGQSERTNQTVEIALRYYMAQYPDGALEWEYVLPRMQFVFNNSINASTEKSPNEMCLDFNPRETTDLVARGPVDAAATRTITRKEATDSLA